MKKSKSNFRGKVNKDAQRQKSAHSNYGYLNLPKNVTVFKEEPGSRVKIDILPYNVTTEHHPDRDDKLEIAMPGTLWYKRPFKTHRNVGPANDVLVCPTSVGKRCPICEYRAKRLKEGAEKEETDAMKASMRNLYVVVPLDAKKDDKQIHVWDISQYLFQTLLNEELEENEENAIFPDLEEGLSLRVRFDSKTIGKSNAFAEASRIDFVERKKQYTEDILEEIPSLDDMLIVLSAKEIEAKFFELEDEDKEEEEEDTKPVRRKTIPEAKPETKKRKPEPEEEEDDDDDDDDEEEEEEEEKPVRRRKVEEPKPTPTRTKKPEPKKKSEPEPDDDEEEEEEEEKPVKKTHKPESPKGGKNKCPFGHVFGKDCEKFDDCDSCDLWDDCIEASGK